MATYAPAPTTNATCYITKTVHGLAKPTGGGSQESTRPESGQMYPRTK